MRLFLSIAQLLVVLTVSQAADILYTGCTNGRIENCRCPNDPLGALEKRLPEIERRRALGDVLLLDSGDFMPPLTDSIASKAVLDIYALTGYDALTLGDQELIQGEELVRKMLEKLPVVSANLTFADGSPIGIPSITFQRGRQTFFVTALFDPGALRYIEPSLVEFVRVLPVEESLETVLTSVPEGAQVIVLSHAGMDRDRQNADEWQGVDLIVGGHSQTKLLEPWTGARIPVVQAEGNGRYLGVARLRGGRVRGELIEMRQELPDDSRVIERLMEMKVAKRRAHQLVD